MSQLSIQLFFHWSLQLRRYKQMLVKVGVFQRMVGLFKRIFQKEGDITHQPLLVSEN